MVQPDALPTGVKHPQHLAQIALESVGKLHECETYQEAMIQFRQTLESMGWSQFLTYEVSRSKGGSPRLQVEPIASVGHRWIQVRGPAPGLVGPSTRDVVAQTLLQRQVPRFVPDAQNDQERETDRNVYADCGIRSIYVCPMIASGVAVGALELDLGLQRKKPVEVTRVIDALVASTAVLLRRIRLESEVRRVERELDNQGKLLFFQGAASMIMHSLKDRMDRVAERIERNRTRPEFRQREVRRLLEDISGELDSWNREVRDEVSSFSFGEDRTRVSAVALAQQVINRWHEHCRARACRLSVRGDPDLMILVRPRLVQELLVCLVVNALEAHANQIEIAIEAEAVDPEDSFPGTIRLRFAVLDNGQGVPQAIKHKIFDLGETTKKDSGLGVGLAMAQNIAKRIGGDLELRSLGKPAGKRWTDFSLLLPFVMNPIALEDPNDGS